MTGREQRNHCEVCEYHKIINCGSINIMSCHYGDYRNHPVWDNDWECPLGDNKPIRKEEPVEWLWDA